VIWSNQAFEIWFIYHFTKISGYLHRDQYASELNKLFNRNKINTQYTKADKNHFFYLKDNLVNAIDNAEFSYQKHIIEQGENPNNACSCTNVYKLVRQLNQVSQNKLF
jgi:hypothetical protein